MRLLEIGIQNFKSLRSVTLKPGPLSVYIGPNGAGKSNLCEALDFIGEMYQWGLELAIARHGGYENICYRHTRRSTAPIVFRVVTSASWERFWLPSRGQKETSHPRELLVEHFISFRAVNQKVRAPFRIFEESVTYSAKFADRSEPDVLFSARRLNDKIVHLHRDKAWRRDDKKDSDEDLLHRLIDRLRPTESFVRTLDFYMLDLPIHRNGLPSFDLYQLNPWYCRSPGVPTPNPELGRDGSNLPGAIDMLKSREPGAFQTILDTLRTIMPTLLDIDVVNTPQRMLGLAFQESGFRQPWPIEHISDGTIRALGLLAALFSSRSDVVVIEEPENSLHPWAIGQFIEACRLASETKQIMLTTHSPVVIDQLKPEEIWVVSKPDAETRVARLVELDPVAKTGWDAGHFTISEYLDSGIVPASVPALRR